MYSGKGYTSDGSFFGHTTLVSTGYRSYHPKTIDNAVTTAAGVIMVFFDPTHNSAILAGIYTARGVLSKNPPGFMYMIVLVKIHDTYI